MIGYGCMRSSKRYREYRTQANTFAEARRDAANANANAGFQAADGGAYYGWQQYHGHPGAGGQGGGVGGNEEGMTFVGSPAAQRTPSPLPNGPHGTAVYPVGSGGLSVQGGGGSAVPSPRPGVAEISPGTPRSGGGLGLFGLGRQRQGQKAELDHTSVHEMGSFR